MSYSLKAEARETATKSSLREMREQGRIPGVVYGKGMRSTPVHIAEKELLHLLRTNPHTVIDMELPKGGKQPVMISQLQRDALKGTLLHVDFHQIKLDEPVRATVALELIGDVQGVRAGGILQVQHHEIDIKCLPGQIPEAIRVDIAHLGLGDNMYISEIPLPEGVELKSDPQEVFVSVLAPQKESAEAETAAPAEAGAEGQNEEGGKE